jgi:hypothetical protein
MPSKKKSAPEKSTRRRKMKPSERGSIWPLPLSREGSGSNGTRYERPLHEDSETDEQREKRLAKREALTLRAFQIAYENHHHRKAS